MSLSKRAVCASSTNDQVQSFCGHHSALARACRSAKASSMAMCPPRWLNKPCENRGNAWEVKTREWPNGQRSETNEGNMRSNEPGAFRRDGATGVGVECVKRRSGGANNGCDQKGRSTRKLASRLMLHSHYVSLA